MATKRASPLNWAGYGAAVGLAFVLAIFLWVALDPAAGFPEAVQAASLVRYSLANILACAVIGAIA